MAMRLKVFDEGEGEGIVVTVVVSKVVIVAMVEVIKVVEVEVRVGDAVVEGVPEVMEEALVDVKPTLGLIVAEPDCRKRVMKPDDTGVANVGSGSTGTVK
jgi:hypothetical protein